MGDNSNLTSLIPQKLPLRFKKNDMKLNFFKYFSCFSGWIHISNLKQNEKIVNNSMIFHIHIYSVVYIPGKPKLSCEFCLYLLGVILIRIKMIVSFKSLTVSYLCITT